MNNKSDFEQFMKLRKEASDEFINGNFDPLGRISAQTSPATIFGPKGDCVQGADQVNAANAKGAQLFKPGGTNTFEIMHMAVDTDLAYWVGIQRSVVICGVKIQASRWLFGSQRFFAATEQSGNLFTDTLTSSQPPNNSFKPTPLSGAA